MVDPKEVVGEEEEKPTIWTSAVEAKIPEDAWEYQIRKSLKDAAYNGLDYVPYSSLMPVPKKDDDPKFMWKKKPTGGSH